MRVLACVAAALVAAGCGGEGGPETEPPAAQGPDDGLHRATGTVLEDETHGPMLCFTVMSSLPPQCGDVPLEGWDWDAVDGEQAVGGTTWGDGYIVTGTYDGETLLVTDVERPAEPPAEGDPGPAFESPCPEPSGGWPPPAEPDWPDPAHRFARAQPEYAGSWVTLLDPQSVERDDEAPAYFLNVVFTARAAEHEAEMRRRWSGPLCVVERQVPTYGELEQIQGEVEAELDAMGIRWLSLAVDEITASVDAGVVADPGGRAQARFDERFGPGVVRVTPELVPVPSP